MNLYSCKTILFSAYKNICISCAVYDPKLTFIGNDSKVAIFCLWINNLFYANLFNNHHQITPKYKNSDFVGLWIVILLQGQNCKNQFDFEKKSTEFVFIHLFIKLKYFCVIDEKEVTMRSISGDACYMQRVFSISTSDNCHQTFLSYSKIKYNPQPNKTLSDMIFIKLINGFFIN